MSLLVSGSIAYDKIMNFPGKFSDHIVPEKIHSLSVAFELHTLEQLYGGNGANISYTLSLFGEKPNLIGVTGSDFAPYKKYLRERGIGLSMTRQVDDVVCSVAHMMTDTQDNQIIGFYAGAQKYSALADKQVRERVEQQVVKKNAYAVISPANPADMAGLAHLYAQTGVPYIADPGQQTTALNKQQLSTVVKGATILSMNDYEQGLIEKKLRTSLGALRKKVPNVIVTLADKGAMWYQGNTETKIPVAKPKQVADPTGAGDAYRAGLLLGLQNGWEPAVAGRVAALCATYAIEQYGTQEHTFTVTSFKRRFTKVFGSTYGKQVNFN